MFVPGWVTIDPLDEAPATREQAMASKYMAEWVEAEQYEWNSLLDNGTFRIAKKPPGANSVGCKWVYKVKLNADGSVERFKARLVAQGYSQKHGIDFFETYSPVMRGTTFRWLLSMAAKHGWSTKMADITAAYLYGKIDVPIYMKQPAGFDNGNPDEFLELLKSLYGLKQSGRIWYQKLTQYLIHTLGCIQSRADPCVLKKILESGEIVYIAIYVDDICFFGDNVAIDFIMNGLKKEFKLRDLGELSYCLGIQIVRNSNGIFIHQNKYIMRLLDRFKDHVPKYPSTTPMEHHARFSKTYEADHPEYSDLDTPIDKTLYQSILGALNYAAVNTRPDISTVVSYLSGYASNPSKKHYKSICRVLGYLKGTADLGIFYAKSGNNEPISYTDAAFNVHPEARSQIGFVIKVADGAISWRSAKTGVVLSSTEAEYHAISELGRELQAFTNLYLALDMSLSKPLQIHEDNLGVIALCTSDVYTKRSKHIDLRHHHIRGLVSNKVVQINYIKSHLQVADMLTKGLGAGPFLGLRKQFGLIRLKDFQ